MNLKKRILDHAFELFADRIGHEMVDSWFNPEYESQSDDWYKEKKQLLWDTLTELESESLQNLRKTAKVEGK